MSDLSRSLVDAAAEAAERIAAIAHSVRGEAVIAARSGQMARLESLADDLLALSAGIRSSPAAVLETLADGIETANWPMSISRLRGLAAEVKEDAA